MSSAPSNVPSREFIERVLSKPTTTPEELYHAGIYPCGRNGIYDACRSGDIESFRVGKRVIIPTAPLRRKLGIEAA